MEWISVKDKFPESFQECLVCYLDQEYLEHCFDLSIYNDGIFFGWQPGNIIENVTHWMPLPKPPQK